MNLFVRVLAYWTYQPGDFPVTRWDDRSRHSWGLMAITMIADGQNLCNRWQQTVISPYLDVSINPHDIEILWGKNTIFATSRSGAYHSGNQHAAYHQITFDDFSSHNLCISGISHYYVWFPEGNQYVPLNPNLMVDVRTQISTNIP
jgi:hypothetical protein